MEKGLPDIKMAYQKVKLKTSHINYSIMDFY